MHAIGNFNECLINYARHVRAARCFREHCRNDNNGRASLLEEIVELEIRESATTRRDAENQSGMWVRYRFNVPAARS